MTCSVVGISLAVAIPVFVISTTVGEAVAVDSTMLASVTADGVADIVGCAVVTSNEIDVSPTDVGSNVVTSDAAYELPDIVNSVVLSSADDVLVNLIVATPVLASVIVDVAIDTAGWVVVTSADATLPAETVDSGEVTLSVDLSVAIDSMIAVSEVSDTAACVVRSWVVLAAVAVVMSATVDK